MSNLIISVSGLRGIIGTGLTPMVAAQYAAAFGSELGGGEVLVGRDSRPTGTMIKNAVMAGLSSVGCEPIDLGITATPTCGYLVQKRGAVAGVEISASHNPSEWNGIKLFHREGRVLTAVEGERILARYEKGEIEFQAWDRIQTGNSVSDPHQPHLEAILSCVDVDAIRSKQFDVALDSNHGAGSILGLRLLNELGCTVTVLGELPDGNFQHIPEPVPENLTTLGEAVRQTNSCIGFAQDPDADRLAIVDETGHPIGEELTITLVADQWLTRHNGDMAVNLSTTRSVNDIAARHGVACHRSAVGEANVVELMKAQNAVIGGEGNGGVILPDVVLIRDSFSGMALMLESLALRGSSVSQLVKSVPRYAMVKSKVHVEREKLSLVLADLPGSYPEPDSDSRDGVRLDWSDRWVHIRPSNTEPIARVIAEAPTQDDAVKLAAEFVSLLEK